MTEQLSIFNTKELSNSNLFCFYIYITDINSHITSTTSLFDWATIRDMYYYCGMDNDVVIHPKMLLTLIATLNRASRFQISGNILK